ncbi:MAG: TetR family transcriptional regulator [Oscillospiraceae bacterium]|nr:TetR family transcriptional regulator [Oscillospiraceae bacterium]
MPKSSPERTNARKEEIIAACETLYQTMGFKEITIKEIADYTSFSRPSIYNYFETKEEIFLALLQKEYERWIDDLDAVREGHDALTRDELAGELARTLEAREQLLKLMSMNHYDMEANSRMERLTEFKRAYGLSLKAVERLLEKFCPDLAERERQAFLYAFFPFIYGIYPYAMVTDRQREAMDKAEVGYIYHSIYDLAYSCAKKLLEWGCPSGCAG